MTQVADSTDAKDGTIPTATAIIRRNHPGNFRDATILVGLFYCLSRDHEGRAYLDFTRCLTTYCKVAKVKNDSMF